MKNVQQCEVCKETNLFMDIIHEFDNENILIVRVRYDLDCGRNEFDIELVEYYVKEKDNRLRNTDNFEWTNSFNTNYCPICGRKMNNQRDDKYQRSHDSIESFKVMISKEYDWVLAYDNEKHKVFITFGLNELNNKLELWLYIDEELQGTASRKINYDPVDGKEL